MLHHESVKLYIIIKVWYNRHINLKYRLEGRKRGELPKKIEVQNDELSALQKRLEEKKRQRKQEQASQRIGASTESAQRTRNLINQKVCIE